jgi:hypothetical protein
VRRPLADLLVGKETPVTIIPVPVANLQLTVTAIGAVAGVLYSAWKLADWSLDRIVAGFLDKREPEMEFTESRTPRAFTAIRGGTHAPGLGVIRSGGRGAALRRVDSRGRL